MVKRDYQVPFSDFDYATPAQEKYHLETDQRGRLLTLWGKKSDVDKFANDFSLSPYND